MKKIILFTIVGLILTACNAVDPSVNDVKSPCVSFDDGTGQVPCERRNPVENYIA